MKGIWILLGMLGEVCVTNRGRFRKPHVQTDAWMLLTSVGSNSGPFVPRMRRNRKGSGCCTDLKSIFLACWGLSRGTVLALRSAQSLSSTCDQPEVPEPSWGQSTRAAGRGGGSLIFITWMLECEDKDLNGASKILPWQCCLPQSLPSHPFAGISGDWSGNSLSWSHVSPSAGAAAVPAAGCHCLRMMQCHTRICGSLQDARVQIQAGGLPGSRLDWFLQSHLAV